jgi:phenylacetaldehyde dehydrogenase
MTATLPEALSDPARSFAAGPHGLLIGGERADAADGQTFETLDPSTGQPIATVALGGAADVDAAARSARAALEGKWGSLLPAKRAALIDRLADLVEEHGDELAQLESLDTGKPVKLARFVDVGKTIDHLRYFAGWPK